MCPQRDTGRRRSDVVGERKFACDLISHTVLIIWFCRSQLFDTSVNLLFLLVIVRDKLTNVCRN